MPALKRIMFRVELPGALKRSYPRINAGASTQRLRTGWVPQVPILGPGIPRISMDNTVRQDLRNPTSENPDVGHPGSVETEPWSFLHMVVHHHGVHFAIWIDISPSGERRRTVACAAPIQK